MMFFLTDVNKKLEELKYRLLKVVHKKEPKELKEISVQLNQIYEEICEYQVDNEEPLPSFGLSTAAVTCTVIGSVLYTSPSISMVACFIVNFPRLVGDKK